MELEEQLRKTSEKLTSRREDLCQKYGDVLGEAVFHCAFKTPPEPEKNNRNLAIVLAEILENNSYNGRIKVIEALLEVIDVRESLLDTAIRGHRHPELKGHRHLGSTKFD
jgi:hypothetical protein